LRSFSPTVFTDGEIEYSMSMKFPRASSGCAFRGKEAVSKAFAPASASNRLRNIDIQKKPSGEPFLVFLGRPTKPRTRRGVTAALVTLSHTEHHAVACVVLEVRLLAGTEELLA